MPTGTPGALEHALLGRYGQALAADPGGPWEVIRLAAQSPPEVVLLPGDEPDVVHHCSSLFDFRFHVVLEGGSLDVVLYKADTAVIKMLRHRTFFQALTKLARHCSSGGSPEGAPAVFDAAVKDSAGAAQHRLLPGVLSKDGLKKWRTSLPPGGLFPLMVTVYDHDLTNLIKQQLRLQTTFNLYDFCAGELSNRQAHSIVEYLHRHFSDLEHALRGQRSSQDVEISFAMGGEHAASYGKRAFYQKIFDSALRVSDERSVKVVVFSTSNSFLTRADLNLIPFRNL